MSTPPERSNSLAKLCADRPLSTTEIFEGNAYYGIGRVLKRYTGLPARYAIKGVWPHGLVYNRSHVWDREKDVSLPVAFCYPEYRASAYSQHTDKHVILSASPFVYAFDQITATGGERSGTLFFPAHSTHHITAEMNYERLADRLDALDERYRPVTVCIYWKDFLMGRHEIFEERGFPVVSAGHMYDPDFLYRLAALFTDFQYAAGNSMGSHLFYSVHAGCQYFHVDDTEYKLTSDDTELFERDRSSGDSNIEARVRKTFLTPEPQPYDEQMEAARYFLGVSHKKSPAGLRSDLLRAEWADKAWAPRRDPERLLHYAPPFWRRTILSPVQAALRS